MWTSSKRARDDGTSFKLLTGAPTAWGTTRHPTTRSSPHNYARRRQPNQLHHAPVPGSPASGPSLATTTRHNRITSSHQSTPDTSEPQETAENTGAGAGGFSRRLMLVSVLAAAGMATAALHPNAAMAAGGASVEQDTAKIGLCVINECRGTLAKCIVNPMCLANLVCINTCNNRPDMVECQIKCGDLFDNKAIGEFNACAVSQKKCVPRRPDDGSYPALPASATVPVFFTNKLEGQWYISAGLNPIFDTFDCQVHFFTAPAPGRLYGKLNWRIQEPDGEFFTKSTIQQFKQDPKKPGVLYNHDNEYLHYEDDWYVLDYSDETNPSKNPDAFVLIYYRGNNDAWDGYGGAVLYTRSKTVPDSIRGRVAEACKQANIDFSNFRECDNTCGAEANPTLLREQYAKSVLLTSEKNVEKSLAEELTRVRQNAVETESEVSKEFADAIKTLEKGALDFEKREVNQIVKEVEAVERAVLRTSTSGTK